jgi:hypothetical protein
VTPPIEYEALGFDPAPGDVAGVDELGERYRRISDKLSSAADSLAAIGGRAGLWTGEAADSFFEHINRLPDHLARAIDSTGRAGSALGEWAKTLRDLQDRAYDLEMKARKAKAEAEAAGNDPALGLAWQQFFDPESLGAAQRLLDAAAARLNQAIDNLNAIQEAAQRLKDEHTEAAEHTAGQLDQAGESAPDRPRGGIGGLVDDVGGALGDFAMGVGEWGMENANRIEAVSGFLSDVSGAVGLLADTEIPGLSQALGGVSIVLDTAALGGLAIADAGGASVSGTQYAQASVNLMSDIAGFAPAVPQSLGRQVVSEFTDLAGSPYQPRDTRQAIQLGASFIPPVGATARTALAVENMARDEFSHWGEEWRAAEERDEAANEARSR